MIEVVENITNN